MLKFNEYGLLISLLFLAVFIGVRLLRAKFYRRTVLFSSNSLIPEKMYLSTKLKIWAPRLFFWLGIILLLVALARPQKGLEEQTIRQKGLATMLLVDRSGSMQNSEDPASYTRYNGEKHFKLDAVKDILDKFVMGGEGFAGRKNDLLGLITFAGFANENCPLTFEHDNLVDIINAIEPAEAVEDGTSIGDAIQYATLVMNAFFSSQERHLKKQKYEIKDRIFILLTDGKNNYGRFDPIEAAEFAKKNHVKIYTIGISDSSNRMSNVFGDMFNIALPQADFSELEKVADLTGGKFYKAKDGEEIKQVYQEIDQLEKTVFQSVVVSYKELFPIFMILGFLALLFSQLLNFCWAKNYLIGED